MKLSKIFLVLTLALAIVSCKNDDDGVVQFSLTNANLAGMHDLTFFEINADGNADVGGIPVPVNLTAVGDTFDVDFNFNSDGTYTAEGTYRLVTTISVAGVSETDSEIFVLDENGTFSTNANNQTLTINGAGNLGEGVFNVTLFNETELRMTRDISQEIQGATVDGIAELRFLRQ